jgi:Raf kinase inhibitor-like YbhB/YbcL family protein
LKHVGVLFGFLSAAVLNLAPFESAFGLAKLSVNLEDLTSAGRLPVYTAFCMPKNSGLKPQDKSPGLDWSPGPAGTQSYVVISIDPDVTTDLSLMNKPGVTIKADSPRQNIYHWALIDIPPDVHRLAPGDDGDGFIPGGKPIGPSKVGVRGVNDYWYLFNNPKAAPAMRGPYGGYDGPCPPNNDERVHNYRFIVYALDTPTLPLSGAFFAPAVLKAMQGHILAEGEADAMFTFDGK